MYLQDTVQKPSPFTSYDSNENKYFSPHLNLLSSEIQIMGLTMQDSFRDGLI